jgi:hypothetical protein
MVADTGPEIYTGNLAHYHCATSFSSQFASLRNKLCEERAFLLLLHSAIVSQRLATVLDLSNTLSAPHKSRNDP